MKGIILAGGIGSRLYPTTLSINKQLLPIYDKPMIYYSLSILMQAGIRNILIISTPYDLPRFQYLLGDGSQLGISISFAEQKTPNGIAEAFIIAETFIEEESVAFILGDNIFYGLHLQSVLTQYAHFKEGGIVFGYHVTCPERYGVIVFNDKKEVCDIVEKPKDPPSPYAVTGLYFYDNQVVEIAKNLKPSFRNELEITDVNRAYLQRNLLYVHLFGRGIAWFDTGTYEDLHRASAFVHAVQERKKIKIGCIEEVAYQMGFIDHTQFLELAESQKESEYGKYLFIVAEETNLLEKLQCSPSMKAH